MFSGKCGPNETGPAPFVKLWRLGGSGFDVDKDRFVATSTKGACEGEWLGELDVVSDGEVVFGDVVVVEDDEEVVSLDIFILSSTFFASSNPLFLMFSVWEAPGVSKGNTGASIGVGGAILLWTGCELQKKINTNYYLYLIIEIFKILT